jgi:hypothetical protein
VVAVWVTTDDGKLVKTVARWGRKQAKQLARWSEADGTATDGVTGATLRSHQPQTVRWDCAGRDGGSVPKGTYRIHIEMADDNKPKKRFHYLVVPFEKGTESSKIQVPDKDGFRDVRLDYVVSSGPSPSTRKVVRVGDVWKYLEGRSAPPKAWNGDGFDDASWKSGPTGLGYGDDDDATKLDSMKGASLTVYLRRQFELEDPSRLQRLSLRVDYDDGFVAFINGKEIARRNVPEGQDHRTPASKSREAGEAEMIDLSACLPDLKKGSNIIALEVHNQSLESSDLSILPELLVAEVPPGSPPQ